MKFHIPCPVAQSSLARLAIMAVVVLTIGLPAVRCSVIFSDGFESGNLGSEWSVSATAQGRARVLSTNLPATGTHHLVLDDSSTDGTYSVSEAMLSLDLSGITNARLSFKVKSLGNEPHYPPDTSNALTTRRDYDGVAVSLDNGGSWKILAPLADVPIGWKSFSVPLIEGGTGTLPVPEDYAGVVKIRFSEYDNSEVPYDGLAFDDIEVTGDLPQFISLELPSEVLEGSGPHQAFIYLAHPTTEALVIDLIAYPDDQLNLPTAVTVPAGLDYVSFPFSVREDDLLNYTRTVQVFPSQPDSQSLYAMTTVLDNDALHASLSLPAIYEGQSGYGRVTLDKIVSLATSFDISTNSPDHVFVHTTATVSPGENYVDFWISMDDNNAYDGDRTYTVTIQSPMTSPVTSTGTIKDNEEHIIGSDFYTTHSIYEGARAELKIYIYGTFTVPLVVQLFSPDAPFAIPSEVIIPAGSTTGTFTIEVPNNDLKDGTRIVHLTASVSGFTSSAGTLSILDNDQAGYGVSAYSAPINFATNFQGAKFLNISAPLQVSIYPTDIAGNRIPRAMVNLDATNLIVNLQLPDGSRVLLPRSVFAPQGVSEMWETTLTVPNTLESSLRFHVQDSLGNQGLSERCEPMRTLPFETTSITWDETRQRIYASVSMTAASHAGEILAIDPVSLQILSSFVSPSGPGLLAMSFGDSFLYLGNNNITKINPADFSISSSFGNSGWVVEDLLTPAGNPEVVIVSRMDAATRKGKSVEIYDHGVLSPARLPAGVVCDELEPSTDPGIFFGHDKSSSSGTSYRIQWSTSTMTKVGASNFSFYSPIHAFQSFGNQLFTNGGYRWSDITLPPTFLGFTGIVATDVRLNRVYYLETAPNVFPEVFHNITVYDPLSLVKQSSAAFQAPYYYSNVVGAATSLSRWGQHGLAIQRSGGNFLVHSNQLVPSTLPADLSLTLQVPANAAPNSPMTFTLQVTNAGPNPAVNTIVSATVSGARSLDQPISIQGVVSRMQSSGIMLGTLAVGETATITLTASSEYSPALSSCEASANSGNIDPHPADNTLWRDLSAARPAKVDQVQSLALNFNNLVYDPTRNLLWGTIPASAGNSSARSLISVNPLTGAISTPLPLYADPTPKCMAISDNGHYLFIGLLDRSALLQVDLTSPTLANQFIPLSLSSRGRVDFAGDLEMLHGMENSFLMVSSVDQNAIVYDDAVPRPARTAPSTLVWLARTRTPGQFVGSGYYFFANPLIKLSVDALGVSVSSAKTNQDLSGDGLVTDGDFLANENGALYRNDTLETVPGSPVFSQNVVAIDAVNERYFRAWWPNLKAYDITTGELAGELTLPSRRWFQCTRWGPDGLALSGEGTLIILRWSEVIPATKDSNNNDISDRWEINNFANLTTSPTADADGDSIPNVFEYVFGSDPNISAASPLQVTASQGHTLTLQFPRRLGLKENFYTYEVSSDLSHWFPAENISETILNFGVDTETISAELTCPANACGFARLKVASP